MKRGDIVIDKKTGQRREVQTVFYRDGELDFIRTVDPITGHDPADHLPEDLDGV